MAGDTSASNFGSMKGGAEGAYGGGGPTLMADDACAGIRTPAIGAS
eukprot:CAMPEP_0181298446 /NCGR_PEP_ID=MMETSP1101-20121128/5785_1 /TAXON_ID=46948 /ORGANISM="Rhodomonas abbreviata, Strain Caron Lab Isolate" /LENGTH=45 /DNA_ID= /DNA_START= /DNA_END= /DNA_ORIENTATION=